MFQQHSEVRDSLGRSYTDSVELGETRANSEYPCLKLSCSCHAYLLFLVCICLCFIVWFFSLSVCCLSYPALFLSCLYPVLLFYIQPCCKPCPILYFFGIIQIFNFLQLSHNIHKKAKTITNDHQQLQHLLKECATAAITGLYKIRTSHNHHSIYRMTVVLV